MEPALREQGGKMDRTARAILIGCSALGIVAVVGIVGSVVVWRWASTPSNTGTVRADKGGSAGDPAVGATVTVPAGAVDHDVKITLDAKPPESRAAAGVKLVGRVWDVKVDGRDRYSFKKPVTLSL